MTYIGSWAIDDVLTFYVNTQRFDTGAATDADSVPTYRVYENETTTPILTGSMALLDAANTAGWYSEAITLSAANGFEISKCYSIYIAATVNLVAGTTHRTFQMLAAVNVELIDGDVPDDSATLVDLIYDEATSGHTTAGTYGKAVTDDNTKLAAITLTTANRVDAQVFGIQANAITATSIASDAITDAKVASDVTIASVTGAVGSVTGAVGSVTGSVGGNVTGTVGSVVGAVGSVVGNVGGNVGGNVTGSVGSVATGGIVAASFATNAIAAAAIATDAGTEIADALLDRSAGIETGMTFRQAMRLMASVLLGKASALDSTPIIFRDVNDSKARVTVTQTSSARTAVTLDAT